MIVYHGVSEIDAPETDRHMLRYSAGVMIFSKEHPLVITYRSVEPVLTPMLRRSAMEPLTMLYSLRVSTGATILELQTVSTSTTGWRTAGLVSRALTCQKRYWLGLSLTRRRQRYKSLALPNNLLASSGTRALG